MIRFGCPSCEKTLKIKDEHAGRKVTCPRCGEKLTVPAGEPPPSQAELDAAEEVAEESVAEDEVAGEASVDGGPESTGEPPPAEETATRPKRRKKRRRPAADTDVEAEEWAAYDEERRAFKKRSRTDEDELDMTPMVDVTFLLLIFFMITASFQMQRSLPASPPEAEQEAAASAVTEDEPDEEPVIVEVSEDNAVFIDGRRIPLPEVADALIQLKAETPRVELVMEVDPAALHGTVVTVVDGAAAAGIERVGRTTVGQ